MIFSPELAQAVLGGGKTVTRRPVKFVFGDCDLSCRYEVGRDYAIQPGRGKKGIGRLRVLDVEMQPLSDALTDFKAEGFFTADAFKAYWSKLYGGFDGDLAVWRIEFELEPDRA